MKWFITFSVGALSGAFALFIFLNLAPQVEDAAPWPTAAVSVPAVISAPVVMSAPPETLPNPVLPAPSIGAPPDIVQLPAAPLPELLNPPATPVAPPISANVAALAVQNRPFTTTSPSVILSSAVSKAKPSEKLLIPVAGIKAAHLTDTFNQARGPERRHEAIDIMAPTGSKVFAVADGRVVKLFNSKQGGLTAYQFDKTETFSYYYAHLDQYAPGVSEGTLVKRGDLIGYVGSTGNARPDSPHLHFAIFELTAEKQWWKGMPVNPYPLFQE